MEAGKLRERIQIQSYTHTRGTNGERIKEWTEFETRWAEVRVSTEKSYTKESFEGNKTNSYVVYDFILRGRIDIKQNMRVFFEGRYFDITGVVPEGLLGRKVRLICTERPDAGAEY